VIFQVKIFLAESQGVLNISTNCTDDTQTLGEAGEILLLVFVCKDDEDGDTHRIMSVKLLSRNAGFSKHLMMLKKDLFGMLFQWLTSRRRPLSNRSTIAKLISAVAIRVVCC